MANLLIPISRNMQPPVPSACSQSHPDNTQCVCVSSAPIPSLPLR